MFSYFIVFHDSQGGYAGRGGGGVGVFRKRKKTIDIANFEGGGATVWTAQPNPVRAFLSWKTMNYENMNVSWDYKKKKKKNVICALYPFLNSYINF